MTRVQLRPGLRRIWRGPQTLQLGLAPGRATVVDGLTEQDRLLLELLEDGIDLTDLSSGRVPPGPTRGHQLIQLLAQSDALLPTRGRAALARVGPRRRRLESDAAVWSLVDAEGDGWHVLARRSRQAVLVIGGGRLGTAIAVALAAAGVRVRLADPEPVLDRDVLPGGALVTDVGEARELGARLALKRAGLIALWDASLRMPPTDEEPEPGGTVPDLVVLVEHGAADAGTALPLLRADVPHLSVLVRETDVLIGPLVRPGRGPCLRCLDLHRADRDPAWPRMLAQLLARDGGPVPEESTLTMLAAGLAGLQALGQLDGRSVPSLGATLEVTLPAGLVGRRVWPAHPACGCTWPPEQPGDLDLDDLDGPPDRKAGGRAGQETGEQAAEQTGEQTGRQTGEPAGAEAGAAPGGGRIRM